MGRRASSKRDERRDDGAVKAGSISRGGQGGEEHERAGCSGGVGQQGGEDVTLPQGLMGVVLFFVLFGVFFF